MINSQRQEVLRVLEELSEHCPEYRFGQMIANLAFLARGNSERAIWNLEDEEFCSPRPGSALRIGGNAMR